MTPLGCWGTAVSAKGILRLLQESWARLRQLSDVRGPLGVAGGSAVAGGGSGFATECAAPKGTPGKIARGRGGRGGALTAEDEAADGGDEAAEEGVEGEGADAETVAELERPGEQHVEKVGVQHLEAARRAATVLRQEAPHHRAHRARGPRTGARRARHGPAGQAEVAGSSPSKRFRGTAGQRRRTPNSPPDQ